MNDTIEINFWKSPDFLILVLRAQPTFYPNYHVGDIIYLNGDRFKILSMCHYVRNLGWAITSDKDASIFAIDINVERTNDGGC